MAVVKGRSAAAIVLTAGALLCTLGMFIGAFGPWAKVLTASIGGTDDSNDGWLVFGAAVVSLGFLLVYAFYRPASRWLMIGPLAAGIVGAAVTIYDRSDLSNRISRANSTVLGQVAQIGWGLNLAMVASILVAVIALIAVVVVAHPAAPFLPPPAPPSPTSDLERLSKLHESGELTEE